MRRKMILFVALVMGFPLAMFADDVSFTSSGGAFSGTSQGYVLTNATLTQVTGLGGDNTSGDLGTLSFSTAELSSISSVIVGGPITPGGTLTISGNGSDGLAAGTLFTGTFAQGGTWGYVMQNDGTYLYTLTANVSGQGPNSNLTGTMTFTIDTGPSVFPGYTSASGTGTLSLVPVPEPGGLTLLGTSLLLAGSSWAVTVRNKRRGGR
jgi:hypothetical protein